ncbi:hypothetical protein ACF08B_29970 [Streptomyces sp. NPDC015139]|uniref:hypothetical protein n=1 Tax=Streptomyces sp. NPDC015139 TaxID=3364942 RepID=UPI00370339DB
MSVSPCAMEVTRLVVSEQVTNAGKYAPGPALMDVRIDGDAVEVVVRDSDPVLRAARAADAGRVGHHGLEIVMAVAQALEAEPWVDGGRA